jgi:hypothetical protein
VEALGDHAVTGGGAATERIVHSRFGVACRRPSRLAVPPSNMAMTARRRAAPMGDPVLGRVPAGAGPSGSVRSANASRTPLAGRDVAVAPAIVASVRVGGVSGAFAVVVVDASSVVVVDDESLSSGLDGESSSDPDGESSDPDGESSDPDGESSVAQAAALTVLESNVTAPLRASSRPATVALVSAVIEVKARTVPTKVEPTPSVDELPTCQKTLQAWAPLMRRTWLLASVMSVLPVWKGCAHGRVAGCGTFRTRLAFCKKVAESFS